MNLHQKFYYTLCSLSLIAPIMCYPNNKLVTIPETITVNGTISPELREYGDHLLQEMQKRSDESLEKVAQNFRALTKETVEATTKSTKELAQQLIDGGFTVKVPVNVTSEDIKNAFTAGSYTLEFKIDHNTMVNGSVGAVTVGSFLTSAYQLCFYKGSNGQSKDISSKDVIIPAALASIGLLYLALKNGPKHEAKPAAAVTTSTTPAAQPNEPKSLLAQTVTPESTIASEESKKKVDLKALTQTGANHANRTTIAS